MLQIKAIWLANIICTLTEFVLNNIYFQACQIEINGEVIL